MTNYKTQPNGPQRKHRCGAATLMGGRIILKTCRNRTAFGYCWLHMGQGGRGIGVRQA